MTLETRRSAQYNTAKLHHMVMMMFPDAVSVEIFVTAEGINVNPTYVSGKTMKDINGRWINMKEETE